MNLWTDSERKWALEYESKPEIKEKHLYPKDMSIYVTYNPNFHCS